MMLDYPQIYDSAGKRLAILNQATDVIITDQIITDTNGQSTLTFNLPYDDPKLDLFDVEDQVHVAGMVFVIRTIQNGWDSQGTLKAQIYAEALWYELSDYDPIQPMALTGANAQLVLGILLETSDWLIGTVEIDVTSDFSLNKATNPLAAITALPSIFGGELQFDTVNKTVSLLTQIGEDGGLLYAYSKNLQSNQRLIDSRYLYTRMRAYGANDTDGNPITIASANGGSDYIENYQWYDSTGKTRKVKCYEQTNDQVSDPVALKLWSIRILNVISMPRITYTMQVIMDKDDGIPNIGDVVRIYDPKLKVVLTSRLAQRTYNVLQPWLSTVQLSTALYSLTDQLSGLNSGQSQLSTQVQDIDNRLSNVEHPLYYTNTVYNSSFERLNDDGKPDFWDTSGQVTTLEHLTGDHSLRLDSGQYAQMLNAPIASFKWPTYSTAFMLRVIGSGTLRVSVLVDGVTQTIYTHEGELYVSSDHFDFAVSDTNWFNALRTVELRPATVSAVLKMECTDGTVYVDSVAAVPINPGSKMEVQYTDGPMNENDVMKVRTSDLPDAQVGDMWFRSDL